MNERDIINRIKLHILDNPKLVMTRSTELFGEYYSLIINPTTEDKLLVEIWYERTVIMTINFEFDHDKILHQDSGSIFMANLGVVTLNHHVYDNGQLLAMVLEGSFDENF